MTPAVLVQKKKKNPLTSNTHRHPHLSSNTTPAQKHTFLHSSFKSHIQCPTHTHECTHTQAHTHTSSHRHTLIPTHNGTLVLSHPYIPHTYDTYSQTCHTHVLAPGAHSPHRHTGTHIRSTGTRGLHTQTLIYQTCPDASNPDALLSNTHTPRPPGPHLPALSAHPTPTPTDSASITHDSTQMYTQSSQKTPPHVHTYENEVGGRLSDTLLSPPQSRQSPALSPSSQCPPALCKEPQHRATRSCGGQQSAAPPPQPRPRHTSREPPWAAEQEATPTPRVPRHLMLHPFKGPRALGEARVGVMRSRWLGAPASDDRGACPKWGGGPCLGQLRGGQGSPRGAWRPNSQATTPSSAPCCPSTAPSGGRGSPPPPRGQLEFITTSHPHPLPTPSQPSLFSLVTSGIQMWKPNRLVLKGDQQQGREVAGGSMPGGQGEARCGTSVGPIGLGPSGWRHPGHLAWTAGPRGLGCRG